MSIWHYGRRPGGPGVLVSGCTRFDELFIPPGAHTPYLSGTAADSLSSFLRCPGFKHPDDQIRKAQHLCITAENYEETLKDLKSKGVEFPEDGFDIFQDGRVRFFRDPEGNWIHLVYRTQVPWN